MIYDLLLAESPALNSLIETDQPKHLLSSEEKKALRGIEILLSIYISLSKRINFLS